MTGDHEKDCEQVWSVDLAEPLQAELDREEFRMPKEKEKLSLMYVCYPSVSSYQRIKVAISTSQCEV